MEDNKILNDEEDIANEEMDGADDPDTEMESGEQSISEFAPYIEPRLSEGAVAEDLKVAPTLANSGLELLARRVLSHRGVDIANPAELERTIAPDQVPLQDIFEASSPLLLGAANKSIVGVESVLGDDERERVLETTAYPFSAIAALEITAADNSRWGGTGWFITPRVLITAGHCVYIHSSENPRAQGWVRSIRVIPGRNGTGPQSEPFGSVVATRFRSVSGWVKAANPESDYGAIILPEDQDVGKRVGTFGFASFSNEDLEKLHLNIAGYPTDKTGVERQTLWYGVKGVGYLTPNQVFYDIDTYGGQSGAPVYICQRNERIAVAVHAYGTWAGVTSNSGTRITPSVFDRIETWKKIT